MLSAAAAERIGMYAMQPTVEFSCAPGPSSTCAAFHAMHADTAVLHRLSYTCAFLFAAAAERIGVFAEPQLEFRHLSSSHIKPSNILQLLSFSCTAAFLPCCCSC
jgi:hypothetical protein